MPAVTTVERPGQVDVAIVVFVLVGKRGFGAILQDFQGLFYNITSYRSSAPLSGGMC
jgi:hypothetical protein